MGTVLSNSQLWSVSRGAGALPLQGPFQLPTAGSVPSKGCGRAAGKPCCRGGDGGRTRVWVLERGAWARLQKAERRFGTAEDRGARSIPGVAMQGIAGRCPASESLLALKTLWEGGGRPSCLLPVRGSFQKQSGLHKFPYHQLL